MAKKGNARAQPGDIRLDPEAFLAGEQPLDADGKALVRRAYELFELFREQLVPAHEEMRQARRARELMQEAKSDTSPTSMTLNSCIDNVIADQIDNMPEAIMMPEREESQQSAEEMTDVVGFVLYKAGWPGKYHRLMEDAAVTGTGVAQLFWDEDMMNGEGMANVLAWHPEDFYPDPMYEDIQDGRGCFKATQTTVAWVEEHYPDAKGCVHPDDIRSDEEISSMTLDVPTGDGKVTLLEFWYKRYDAGKRKYRVHMAQFAGHALLYSTELGVGCSKVEYAEGIYAHGQYPFHMFKYRNVFRKPFGTGLYRDYKTPQEAIDRYAKYIDDNARESSVQRHFIRRGSGVNTEDVADMSKTIIEWDGSDIREVLQTVQASPINGQVYQMMNFLVDAMKNDSGQNAFNRGETSGGVTANSAIQSLVSQGNKITRMHVEQFKDVFRGMIEQMLWLLSEYLTPDREIRIVGGWDSGGAMKDRVITLKVPDLEGDKLPPPAYSVRVQAQKHNPIWSERFNEMVMRAAEISAQGNRPIQPVVLFEAMQGYPDKGRVVKMLRESDAKYNQIEQLQAQNQELTGKLAEKEKLVAGWEDALSKQGGAAMMKRMGSAEMPGQAMTEAASAAI